MEAGSARILVVEDDPDLMRIISRALDWAGYEVIRAYGGEDAVRKVKAKRPALILTDLAMPKVSGVDVIRRVKADPDTERIPCIAVTAFAWDAIGEAAAAAGCNGFVSKPFKTARLLEEVAKFVRAPRGRPPRSVP